MDADVDRMDASQFESIHLNEQMLLLTLMMRGREKAITHAMSRMIAWVRPPDRRS
ncbi:hypothetical protein [Microvirga rosea]|uniref:hypothetical protein n=1 Tax=Microvirga rosea TaxID=2715425 RepID=UPI001D0A7372|nr:hypothetical protein [Microvirga rosea]MCB8821894.1 hypothetical protein [Microvirga rosea]